MSPREMTINDVAEEAGLEISQVRFLTSVLDRFFGGACCEGDGRFGDEELNRLKFVKDLTENQCCTIEEVQRELESDPNPHCFRHAGGSF